MLRCVAGPRPGVVSQKGRVHLYSGNLTDKQIRDALLIPCHSFADTVQELIKRYGPSAAIRVLPDGPQTVPYVSLTE